MARPPLPSAHRDTEGLQPPGRHIPGSMLGAPALPPHSTPDAPRMHKPALPLSSGAGAVCSLRPEQRAQGRGLRAADPSWQPPRPLPGPGLLPSTQAGRALVVPAICPFLHAHRAVCRAIVLRGWLLSRSKVTISQVPAAS